MKLFGKSLFDHGPKTMWDFAQFGLIPDNDYFGFAEAVQIHSDAELSDPVAKEKREKERAEKKKRMEENYKTPKQIYELKALNDNKFFINSDKTYLEQQIKDIDTKLDLLLSSYPDKKKKRSDGPVSFAEEGSGGVIHGKAELRSMKQRLENRFKLDTPYSQKILTEYPHTTSELINSVVHKESGLRFKRSEEFIPDFPREAIKAMQLYNDVCQKLCSKDAIFYVVAAKKDFEKVTKRRDPILLAQSPFGFFWQILGAWDEEMIYLGDL